MSAAAESSRTAERAETQSASLLSASSDAAVLSFCCAAALRNSRTLLADFANNPHTADLSSRISSPIFFLKIQLAPPASGVFLVRTAQNTPHDCKKIRGLPHGPKSQPRELPKDFWPISIFCHTGYLAQRSKSARDSIFPRVKILVLET